MSSFLLFAIVMTANTRLDRRLQILFHTLGLSCLGGATFLQVLMFTDILQRGRFTAIESNLSVLSLEIGFTAFALVYFLYMYQRFIRTAKRPL